MPRQKCRLLSLVCLLSSGSLCAAEPTWSEKFLAERSQAFGPVKRHSTQEVREFLLLKGKPVHHSDVVLPRVPDPVGPAVNPAKETSLPPPPKKRRARKPAAARKNASSERVPIEALLEKSRQAYATGQLEEARRYYSYIKKVDPSSVEATERLAEIEKEMR